MSINKENLPLYIVAFGNKTFEAKGHGLDGPFSKLGIWYYMVI
jgi:hypothetical protein